MIVLVGETASGKSTLEKALVNQGLIKIISYTTRPIRDGEVDGKDYYFISDEEYMNLLNEDKILAHYTSDNGWHYGLKNESYPDNSICILTPSGLVDIKENTDFKVVSFHIKADRDERKLRAIHRGDNKVELLRRLKADDRDFVGIEEKVDYVIVNDGYINNMLKSFREKLNDE